MAQTSAWLQAQPYQAVDDRYAMISALWDEMNYINITDSTHVSAGVVRSTPSTSMKVLQHAAGAAMSVDVQPGQILVSVLGDQRGSYIGVLDAVKTIAITAADPTLGRVDSIWAIITDETFGEATSQFQVTYIQGTPAVSPVAPTQPTAYAVLLANITVGAAVTSILTANILDTRHQITPKMCTGLFSTDVPLNVVNGSHWYNINNGHLNVQHSTHVTPLVTQTGNAWNTYTPTLTASSSNPTLGTGNAVAGEWRYVDNGDWVMAQGKIVFGTSGVAVGSGTYRVSLPVTAGTINASGSSLDCAGQARLLDSSSGNTIIGEFHVADGLAYGTIEFTNLTAGAASSATNALPWTWAASDEIYWSVIYAVNQVTS